MSQFDPSTYGFKFSTAKRKKSKEDRALETKGSKLERVLDILDRPGASVRKGIINLVHGAPVANDVGKVFKGDVERPSGANVVREIRGRGTPRSTAGRVAEGVAGFALDVLNPLDPLNWVGIGELTKSGKAAQAAGKLSKFSKGLQTGERAFLSARLPFTKLGVPLASRAVSEGAGKIFEGTGKILKAIPGVESIGKFFKPKYEKLSDYAHKQAARASELTGIFKKTGETVKWPKLFKEATERVKSGEFEIKNPEMYSQYKKLGYNPEQIVHAEIKRSLDEGIAARGILEEQPSFVKNFMDRVPKSGATLDVVKELAEHQAAPLKIADELATGLGVRGSLGETFGAPRVMSEETQKAMEIAGRQAGAGAPSAGAERIFKEFTQGQVEAARLDPRVNRALFGSTFGDVATQGAKPFYEMDTAKAFQKYSEAQAKQISTAETVAKMMVDHNVASKVPVPGTIKVEIPSQFSTVMKGLKAKGFPVNIQNMYMTPETAHEFKNFVGIMTDQDKMNSVWGFAQLLFQPLNALTNAFKKLTLFVPPGFLPFLSHNIMGNTVQSAMVGAVSKEGVKDALYMSSVLRKAGDDPALFKQLASQMGEKGQHLMIMQENNLFNEGFTRDFFGDESIQKFMDKYSGAKLTMRINDVAEGVTRIQHYMTRIHQGWTPEAAIKDVRKYLYDYAGNMSPQLQKLKAIFPFLAWTRNNVPVMFQHMLTRPGKFAVPERVKQNVENTLGTGPNGEKPDERALDEYIKGDWHIRWKFDKETGKWSYIRLKNVIPMADLEDFSSVSKMVDFAAASLTPFVKTFVENKANKSLFFKTAGGEAAPIENYKGETGKFLGMDISRKNINWLRNIRPLNMANQAMQMPGSDIAANLAGLGSKSIDFSKATEHAKYAYQKQKQSLLLSKKRQTGKGKPTEDIDKLLEELKRGSYVP